MKQKFSTLGRSLRASSMLPITLALSGCVTFSPQAGMDVVANVAGRELRKDLAAIRTPEQAAVVQERVDGLLRRPLTADAAVQIALLNNRALQAAYNELGLAEAAMVQASLPPNPTFSVQRLSGPASIEIEKRIVANVLALATLPARAEIAADRFRQAQLRAAEETLRLAAETRRIYYRAVMQRELTGFLQQSQTAAEAATKVAHRLGETGAMNKLDQAREQVFYAELTARLATARQRAASERESLARVLGLWGKGLDFKLPSTLMPLPSRPSSASAIEVEAVRRRVDLQIARIEIQALAKAYGLTQATRFINLLEVSGIKDTVKDRATGERERSHGFELEFQIPIFDGGEVRVRQASETYLQAVNRLTDRAVHVRSQARDAYRTYRSTYDIAAHYQREVLPLRKIISDETLLRYNAMLIDVFPLLQEARQRIEAYVAAIEARRDFWLASVDLSTAVVGGGVAGGSTEISAAVAGSPGAGGH